MKRREKTDAGSVEGVQYRRCPTWQIAISQLQTGCAMCFYVLIGMMSYLAVGGYGILMTVAGVILSVTRIFDGLIDPILAVWIDRINTRHGKLRFLLLLGFAVRALAVLALFVWGSGKGMGIAFFIATFLVYIIGNSIYDIAGNMLGPVMTNDPRQRPTVQVWATVYNYMFPMAFSIISSMIVLPMFDNEYSVPMLSLMALITVAIAFVLTLVACVGLKDVDKPENFKGVAAVTDADKVSFGDMLRFLKGNRPFQMYVAAAISDKLAQNVNSQALVTTMMFGILIGNIQFGTIITVISMVPAIAFAIIGARYCGKHGNKKATVTWTLVCTILAVVGVIFCASIDMYLIRSNMIVTVIFTLLLLGLNGAKMCVTTANGAMRADIVDYELDRTGKYLPAVVTATYNFVDQFVTSLGAMIATGCVALIGYTTTAPQPNDASTPAIKWMTMFLFYGLPLLGWLCTFLAMRFYKLTKEEMVGVQRRVQDKKLAAQQAEQTGQPTPAEA